jgi:hypothetical protein
MNNGRQEEELRRGGKLKTSEKSGEMGGRERRSEKAERREGKKTEKKI